MNVAPGTTDRRKPLEVLLYGTLVVGLLDILDALVFFGLRGVAPARILQSIAAGLLGRSAFSGGVATLALGAVLHFSIAFCVVTVYYLASRKLPVLVRRPLIYGPLYGLAVYLVMNFVVIPLSASPRAGLPPTAVMVNGVLIHLLGVGLPAALIVRWGRIDGLTD